MRLWISNAKLRIRTGKKEDLKKFLEKQLKKADCALENLLCMYLNLSEVSFEKDHIFINDNGMYCKKQWIEMAAYLEGFVEWYGIEELFRDVFKDESIHRITPKLQWENEPIEIPKFKQYMIYMDDGHSVFKISVPAPNEKTAIEYAKGNGEIITVKDVSADHPISIEKVREALQNSMLGEIEINLILRVLEITSVAE